MSLASVTDRVERAAARAGRSPDQVTILAISKGRSPREIMRLYEAGQRDFGENRAQELVAKIGEVPADIRWHFVGHLQTNKVRNVRPVVVALHSLDRPGLASAWMKGPGLPPPALLQVNIGREPQKHGVDPVDAPRVCDEIGEIGVHLIGLMAILPIVESPEQARPYFQELRAIRDRLRVEHAAISELSMGMTDDFEVAVEEGATMIRVGRAIFGS